MKHSNLTYGILIYFGFNSTFAVQLFLSLSEL